MSDLGPALPPIDDDDLLAGEYVLGVLDAGERLAAGERLRAEPAFAARVQRWEAHFAPWLLRGEPVVPGAHVWPRIRRDLGWPAVEASERRGLWNNTGFWRAATGLAVAASLGAIAIGLRAPPAPAPAATAPTVQAPPAAEEAAALPVTVLAQEDGRAGWIARVAGDRSKVLMVPVPRPADPGGKVNELWIIAAGQAPKSLGFVSNDKAHSIDIPAALRAAFEAGATLAITIEPEQGIPHAAPSGAIVAKGEITAI